MLYISTVAAVGNVFNDYRIINIYIDIHAFMQKIHPLWGIQGVAAGVVTAPNTAKKQKDPIIQVQLMVGLLKGFDTKQKGIVK